MIFDIIELTDERIAELTTVQMQLLRTAQKRKNELEHDLDTDIEIFRNVFLANGMEFSSLFDDKVDELITEYNRKVDILAEQLVYSLSINEPIIENPGGEGDEEAGYIVDYTLPYSERYRIVRDYYLAIADPAERMNLYANDEVARRYLGTYYSTLYNVLASYSS